MKEIKIGIIGCGFIGNAHYLGYKNDPRVEVVAVADLVSSAAEQFAKRYGIKNWYGSIEKLLEKEDIDAVSVCTPHYVHAESVIYAAEAGKHILVEKPMSTFLVDADNMIEAAKKAGVKLMVGFVSRFIPAFKELKQYIDDGAIGKVNMIRSTRWGALPWSEWYFDPKKGGGILTDRFCYGADYARWLSGSEVEEIIVYGGALVHKDKFDKYGKDFIDNAKIMMRMKNGVLVSAEESYSCGFGYWERLEVTGEEGLLVADPFKHDLVTLWSKKNSDQNTNIFNGLPYIKGWNWPDMSNWPMKDKEWGAFAYETKCFVDCILNDEEPLVNGVDGRAAVEIVNAAVESHRKGGVPVRLS